MELLVNRTIIVTDLLCLQVLDDPLMDNNNFLSCLVVVETMNNNNNNNNRAESINAEDQINSFSNNTLKKTNQINHEIFTSTCRDNDDGFGYRIYYSFSIAYFGAHRPLCGGGGWCCG
mmetsp:Transcript_53597/g.61890  ORF Transcript_53597/g.61890 Transcript_53597/m.61890 type:complete len:118 (-) Transcript_53597:526-879(-)